MIPKSPATQDSDEPRTIHEFEMRRRNLERQEGRISEDPPASPAGPTYPRLPSTSPWSTGIDQLSGVEPAIDRSEDADHFIPTSTEGDLTYG
jgi:hypothetical protein